jgi:hypothetical protein
MAVKRFEPEVVVHFHWQGCVADASGRLGEPSLPLK